MQLARAGLKGRGVYINADALNHALFSSTWLRLFAADLQQSGRDESHKLPPDIKLAVGKGTDDVLRDDIGRLPSQLKGIT